MNQTREEKQRIRENFDNSPGYFGGVPLDHEAPIPVCDCISYLRQRSFFEIGVFRIPGNNDIVERLKASYNKHFPDAYSKKSETKSVLNGTNPSPGVNDVASLLKAFFKELPEPLIPAAATREFVAINQMRLEKEQEAKRYSRVIKRIKSPERECLGLMVSFLRELCSFRRFNNMNADNLSTCFVLSIMGGGNAFDQLFLLREGASIVKKLIKLNVKMYMPSITNVRNNTRYMHDPAEENMAAQNARVPPPQMAKAPATNATLGLPPPSQKRANRYDDIDTPIARRQPQIQVPPATQYRVPVPSPLLQMDQVPNSSVPPLPARSARSGYNMSSQESNDPPIPPRSRRRHRD